MRAVEERVPVVAAFVYSEGKVALIKRSELVGTYRGCWSAFSGYIERLPLNQAYVELAEEAGLSDAQAKLCGMGIPLPVDDRHTGRRWLVFPFLFKLADGVQIETDWETAEWGWFAPEEIGKLETVPGLDRALGRVWPPFGDAEFWNGLAGVAADTKSGATGLARRGLAVLGGYVQENRANLDNPTLIRAIRTFAASRPAMGVFPNLAARLLLAMECGGGEYDFDELVTELLGAVEDAVDLSVGVAAAGLRGKRRVFTLSYSEAVRDAIVAWHADDSEIMIGESGPGKEGIQLADYLGGYGLPVEIVSDSAIEVAVREADAVIVGCDAITDTDEVLNKAGTSTAVLAANDAGVPAYAAAQTFKIMPPGWPVFLERQAPADFDGEGASLVGDAVFDLTPLDKFEAVFTEEGALTPARLAGLRFDLGSVDLSG